MWRCGWIHFEEARRGANYKGQERQVTREDRRKQGRRKEEDEVHKVSADGFCR